MDAPTLMEACAQDLSTGGEDWLERVQAWKERVGSAAYKVAAQAVQTPDAEVFHLVRWDPVAVATLAARKDLPELLLDAIMEDWLARAATGDSVAGEIIRALMGHSSFRPGNAAFALAWSAAVLQPEKNMEQRIRVAEMLLECQRLTDEHLAILTPILAFYPSFLMRLLRHPAADSASWKAMTATTPTIALLEPLMEIDRIRRDPEVARWLHKHLRGSNMASSVGWKLWADAPPLQFTGGVRWFLNPCGQDAPKPDSALPPLRHTPYTYEQVVEFLSLPSDSDTGKITWLLTHARTDAITGIAMDEVTAMTSSSDAALREAAFLALGKYPE